MRIEAEEGKVFKRKDVDDGYLDVVLYLGKGDSIDNYEQVDMAEKEEWLAELEREEKEAQLRALMAELYPPEEQ